MGYCYTVLKRDSKGVGQFVGLIFMVFVKDFLDRIQLGIFTMVQNSFGGLVSEEKRVIENKGTELPFQNEYDQHFQSGEYYCRRCDALLFKSQDKFDAGCGWPSFDRSVQGAVTRQLDPDGQRTEIVCSNCGAHLGHVFEGEGFTDLNTRHCVNSIALVFKPQQIESEVS